MLPYTNLYYMKNQANWVKFDLNVKIMDLIHQIIWQKGAKHPQFCQASLSTVIRFWRLVVCMINQFVYDGSIKKEMKHDNIDLKA